jgi:hypothetical protein
MGTTVGTTVGTIVGTTVGTTRAKELVLVVVPLSRVMGGFEHVWGLVQWTIH